MMRTTTPVVVIVSYVLILLLNGASSRLVQTSIQRRQQLEQQQYTTQRQRQQQQEQQQQQQQEFHHRKLVKLFGEDGTTISADRIDGNYIVVLHENENLDSFLDSLKRTQPDTALQIHHEYRHAMIGFAAEIYSQQTLHALLEDARVKEIAEDGHVYAESVVLTTQTQAPANLDRIDQPTGTDTNFKYRYTGKNDILVYVVDTGIRKTHEDFIKDDGVSRVQDACFTAFDGAGCHDDTLGHGTHVASTVGGKRWGVAKEVKLVSVRVFNKVGIATWASFTAGIDYCTAQQKNSTENIIVNMSMGGPVNPTFDAAVAVLLEEGAIVVAAAGNQNSFSCSRSPPNALGVIGVGNSALTDTRDLTSNYGACVDIWAPGVDIKAASSLCDSVDYCWKSLTGTSMASALVSGTYALYLEAKKAQAITVPVNATKKEVAQEIKQKLLADATTISTLGVLGSADKLLCLSPLNNANGTSVAALATPAAAPKPPAPKAPKNENAAGAGMKTESIGDLGSENDPALQMPVGPGEGGIGPGGKKEESKEEKDKKPAEKKDTDKKDEKEKASDKPKDTEDDKPAEGEKKAGGQTATDEKPADNEKKPAGGGVFKKST